MFSFVFLKIYIGILKRLKSFQACLYLSLHSKRSGGSYNALSVNFRNMEKFSQSSLFKHLFYVMIVSFSRFVSVADVLLSRYSLRFYQRSPVIKSAMTYLRDVNYLRSILEI